MVAKNQYDRELDERFESDFDSRHFRRMMAYLVPHRRYVALVLALMMAAAVFSQSGPYLLRIAIDRFMQGNGLAFSERIRGLLAIAGINLALATITWRLNTVRSYIMGKVGQKILLSMRQQLFVHIERLSFRFFDERPAGKIMSRITNDVGSLNDLITNGVVNILTESLNLVLIIGIMMAMNLKLALISFTVLPAFVALSLYLRPLIREAWRDVSKRGSAINANLNESIQGVRVTQSFVREDANSAKFGGLLGNLQASWMHAVGLGIAFGPAVQVISASGTCLVWWFGAGEIRAGHMEVGTLVAFTGYLGRFWQPISMITNFYNQVQVAMASAERVFGFLDTDPQVKDAPDAVALPAVRGEVVFEGVDFGYTDEKMVLRDINLHVQPGETIALVGPTGAGKTSIIGLINRFYDVQAGRITIDGYDIKQVTLDSLRSQVGIVLQDNFIFSGTVKDNIRYGRLEAGLDEITAAAQMANAVEFINELEDGFDTEVHERGATLSVGQRQLLAIARAIVANPAILVLDEATSNIDTHTEALIQEALERLMRGRTSFVVAHRLSTVRSADRIVVIREGRIAEVGSHNELLQIEDGIYRGLYETQFRYAQDGIIDDIALAPAETTAAGGA